MQGVKSGEILLSSDILASGLDPSGGLRDGQTSPTKGNGKVFTTKCFNKLIRLYFISIVGSLN